MVPGFPDDVFDDIDELMDQIEEEIEDIISNIKKGNFVPRNPLVIGFTLGLDDEGSPVIRTFGDRSLEKSEREPLYEQRVTEDSLSVIVELPGVNKEDIKLDAGEDTLALAATGEGRVYKAEIALKEEVDPETAKATYRNGILEVRFRLKGKTNKGYRPINIE
ncbi:MAG: Hsp20/alpha crystallin family protein [Conexivisphaerales archaeon]